MEDLIKTVFYTGVGIAKTATDRVQQAVDELVEKGKMPKEDGKKMVDEFREEGKKLVEDFRQGTEDRKMDFEDKLKSAIKGVVDKFDLPKKKDYDTLLKRIEKLEKAARQAKATKSTRSTVRKPAAPRTTTPKKEIK